MIYYANAASYAHVPKGEYSDVHFAMVIGSMCGLHTLADSIEKPRSLTFFDIEPETVDFFKWCVWIMERAETFNDYMKWFFRRDFGSDIEDLWECPPDTSWECKYPIGMAKPVGLRATRCGDPRPMPCLEVPSPKNFWGAVQPDFKHYIGIAPDIHYEPRYINCYYLGHGFHSEEGYAKVREMILTVPLVIETSNIFRQWWPNTYLYASGCIEDLQETHADEIAELVKQPICLRDQGIIVEKGEMFFFPKNQLQFTDERSEYYGLQG
jgi:hypothetical protein